jgi:hypothetical protein
MALPILDGNQSATTLSTIVTSGQHIPAHTVVSLGTQAVADITTAISGTSVCVGNLGLLQSTVATEGLSASGSFIKIGGHAGTSTTGNIVHVSSVGALRVDGSVYTQPVSIASVTIGNTVTIAGTVTANPTGTQTIAGTVTANTRNNGISNDPWVYIPRLTMSHPDLGNFVFDGYYRFDGVNQWGNSDPNCGNVAYLTITKQSDQYFFRLMVHDENADAEIEMAEFDYCSPDFPTFMFASGGTLVSGSLTFNTEQRESYGVRITSSVTIGNSVTIGSLPALPSGTNRIGVVTIGAGTVTIEAGTAQIGSVTASISGTVPISISSVTVGNSVTIGSLPAISGTVTANTFALQGTAVTTSNFTSTAPSTVLANYNATREVLTIFNEGAGNLHICVGATCTTTAYQVRLSAGDYLEAPNHQTTITHSAVFATVGTARVTEVS